MTVSRPLVRGGLVLAFVLGVAAAVTGVVMARIGDASRVEISMHYSRFSTAEVTVRAGVPLTVVLRNDDPIDHEWMVGDAAFHERHRTGTEPAHAERPTEVTVPAGSTRVTTVTFQHPGEYLFICHLPGHEAYGMVGVVRVVPGA
jgi:uncharacterized cupredoxin-like copper-binding protein